MLPIRYHNGWTIWSSRSRLDVRDSGLLEFRCPLQRALFFGIPNGGLDVRSSGQDHPGVSVNALGVLAGHRSLSGPNEPNKIGHRSAFLTGAKHNGAVVDWDRTAFRPDGFSDHPGETSCGLLERPFLPVSKLALSSDTPCIAKRPTLCCANRL